MTRSALTKKKAARKGTWAGLAAVGTAASFVFLPWWLGVAGLGATGYFTYKWLKFRGNWGMRF